MIFRIYPSKDSFISNGFLYPNYTRLTGGNVGASEELDVFKRAGFSGNTGDLASSSLSRILLQFDFTQFGSLTSSGDLQGTGVSFFLRMNHKTSADTQPSSFDLVLKPVASGWDEGAGRDVTLRDSGYANWVKRTSTSYWGTPGGDFVASPTSVVHFDTGFEDLETDVTPFVNAWLSGAIANNGIGVMLTASIEADSLRVDYYQKKFYSRQSDFFDRVPYIEARSSDSVRDDRQNMQWGRTGSLWLYNIVGGAYQDLPGNFVTVSITDSSGVLLQLTASHQGTGVYSSSFSLSTGSYSGSLFHDSWGSGSFSFMTGAFSLSGGRSSQGVSQQPLTARIRNLQDQYLPEDAPVLEVLFRRRPHTLPVFQTASLGIGIPYIVEQAYYAIENDSTRERVVPFGTGSEHTRLSYGENGNSFKFFMRNLHSGNVYRIVFLVSEQGRQQVIDNGLRFRVV